MTLGPVVHADTSALGALLVDQSEGPVLLDWLDQTPATLVSSDLLETGLRRFAVREGLDQSDVTRLMDGVALAALDRAVYRSAGFLPMPTCALLMHCIWTPPCGLMLRVSSPTTAGLVRQQDPRDPK